MSLREGRSSRRSNPVAILEISSGYAIATLPGTCIRGRCDMSIISPTPSPKTPLASLPNLLRSRSSKKHDLHLHTKAILLLFPVQSTCHALQLNQMTDSADRCLHRSIELVHSLDQEKNRVMRCAIVHNSLLGRPYFQGSSAANLLVILHVT